MTDSDRQSAMEALKEGGFSPQLNRQSGQLEVDAVRIMRQDLSRLTGYSGGRFSKWV